MKLECFCNIHLIWTAFIFRIPTLQGLTPNLPLCYSFFYAFQNQQGSLFSRQNRKKAIQLGSKLLEGMSSLLLFLVMTNWMDATEKTFSVLLLKSFILFLCVVAAVVSVSSLFLWLGRVAVTSDLIGPSNASRSWKEKEEDAAPKLSCTHQKVCWHYSLASESFLSQMFAFAMGRASSLMPIDSSLE